MDKEIYSCIFLLIWAYFCCIDWVLLVFLFLCKLMASLLLTSWAIWFLYLQAAMWWTAWKSCFFTLTPATLKASTTTSSRSDPWCFQGDQQAPHIPCLLECCSSSVICFSKSVILLWRPLDDLYCSFFSSSIVAFKLFISSLNSFRLDLHSSSFPLLPDEPVDLHFQLIFLIPWV